jgi:hypothetical protein
MKVVFRPEADVVLDEVAEFIDTLNTEGSGDFWVAKFISHLYSYALPNTSYALCNNSELAAAGFSCINYNGWVIAFKIEEDLFVVHKITRGSILI